MAETTISRNNIQVVMGPQRPTVIIGERINPTGKDWLQAAIRDGDYQRVADLAREQVAAGAHIIDVNVMVSGMDEVETLPRAVEAVQRAVEVPLCLDCSRPQALRAALSACDGKVIVNSVNGDADKLESILPLVRRHKAAVIGLTMDKASGIPKTADERIGIAGRILSAVKAEGIPETDLIIDCLTLAVSVEQGMGRAALDTISGVSRGLGLNVNMGISNVSFGLPERATFNAAFVAMAAAAGMTCAIVNPHSKPVLEAILAADVLLGRDTRARNYLKHYRAQMKAAQGAG